MYESVKSCVRSKHGLTEFFRYKEKCLTLLFALFLNDLETDLKEGEAKGVVLWNIQICSLLYEDDLILTVMDENNLKLQMDLLGNSHRIVTCDHFCENSASLLFHSSARERLQFSQNCYTVRTKELICRCIQ